MTLEDIWGALLNKNADLKCPDATVIFKAKNLKSLLQQVYDKGVAAEKARWENMKKIQDMADRFKGGDRSGAGKDFEQMMKDFGFPPFGKK
jgi:hypothetical protein